MAYQQFLTARGQYADLGGSIASAQQSVVDDTAQNTQSSQFYESIKDQLQSTGLMETVSGIPMAVAEIKGVYNRISTLGDKIVKAGQDSKALLEKQGAKGLQTVKKGVTEVKTTVQEGVQNVKQTVVDGAESTQTNLEALKTTVQQGGQDLQATLETGASELRTAAQGGLETLQTTAQEGGEALRTTAQGGLETLQTTAQEGGEALRTTVEEGGEALRTAAQGGLETLQTTAEGGGVSLQSALQGGDEALRTAGQDYLQNALQEMNAPRSAEVQSRLDEAYNQAMASLGPAPEVAPLTTEAVESLTTGATQRLSRTMIGTRSETIGRSQSLIESTGEFAQNLADVPATDLSLSSITSRVPTIFRSSGADNPFARSIVPAIPEGPEAANLQGVFSDVGGFLQRSGGQTAANLQTVGGGAAANLQATGTRMAENLGGTGSQTLENLQAVGTKTAENLSGATRELTENLVTSGTRTAENLSGGVAKVSETLQQTGGALAENVSQTGTKLLSTVTDTGASLLKTGEETLVGLSDIALPVLGEAALAGTAVYGLVKGFEDLFSHPKAPTPIAVPQVANIGQSFQSGI
jgi:hypothetical protein